MVILSTLSGQGSLVGMERIAKRHHQTINELLGTDFGKSPSDSTFRLLLAQLDVVGFESLLGDWMKSQPGVAELDTLPCGGIIAVRSHGIRNGKPTDETRYDVTGLRNSGSSLLRHRRDRLSIRKCWHWVRDVPLREDAHRHQEPMAFRSWPT